MGDSIFGPRQDALCAMAKGRARLVFPSELISPNYTNFPDEFSSRGFTGATIAAG
jgi:hypothetical protein